jgi:hypothetical protein
MTQRQLDRAVARTTGESLASVRRLGFGILPGPPVAMGPEDLDLAVDCPRCGACRRLPCDRHGTAAMAECVPCDLLFDYRPEDVYVAGEDRAGTGEDAAA